MDNIFQYIAKDKGVDVKSIKTLEELKYIFIEKKVIHSKYKNKIKIMDEEQFKQFVYTGIYEEKTFEGVALIFEYICKNDLMSFVEFILQSSFSAISILRLMIYMLSNIDRYSGRLKFTLLEFVRKYERKLKNRLPELFISYKIDKLDLIYFIIKIIMGINWEKL